MNIEYSDLLSLTTLEGFTEEQQIDVIGTLFDLAFDKSSINGIQHGFHLSKQIKTENLKPTNLTLLFYDLSNGWSYLRKIKFSQTSGDWKFQMTELVNEIFHLRKAITSPGFSQISPIRRCQIYTNLGNSFSYIGRFVEAQEYWHMAIEINPEFAMAIGNMANGLYYYGSVLYDEIHKNIFAIFGYHYLVKTLKLQDQIHEDAKKGFQELHDRLKNYIAGNFPEVYIKGFPNLDYDLGKDLDLKNYRLWCLDKKLFINPLNDLGPFPTACHDCLNLPTLTLPSNRPPISLNLYNQIKQEFATARYSFYVSQFATRPHISDNDTPLVETMEMVSYSYYLEQLKIAFRLAYSILDKIAYLLNDYLELKIDNNKVSFRTLWYTTPQKNAPLRAFFENSQNWALRGLYWISKDLYEKDKEFDTVLEPDAKEVATIRNYIEHKGFKISDSLSLPAGIFEEADISYTIQRDDFERKTMKLLKLTRSAIINVAVAIAHEEKDQLDSQALPISTSKISKHRRV